MAVANTGPAEAGLSVVIPCFNEVEAIARVHAEIVADLGHLDLEILFVDDGSDDGTLEAIKSLAGTDPRVRYISFTRNFGFEAAFSAGYRYAGRPWILHLDADQQFPAAEALRLIDASPGQDAVFGVRTERKDSWTRRSGTALFHFLAARVLNVELPPGATAFRLVRSPVARAVVDLELGTPYFLATLPKLTSRYVTVPVRHRERLTGSPKATLRRLAAHAAGLFVTRSGRLTSAASGLALAGAGLAALAAAGAALGGLGQPAGATVSLLLAAVSLGVLAFLVRHQATIAAGQARPRLFYVREASIPIAAEDLLCRPAETSARRP
ncbi:glycosyl transferase [Acrocarpospora pleiomorpha]|uniref:Glycosyl transferase n=1 Tax=Acrocarpospora pleiomorpha TaxID=90975 RepID=A0A5M3XMV4_9ACTN|nr:glycosyl transferase [Acrocarpospora pleiomorpha]